MRESETSWWPELRMMATVPELVSGQGKGKSRQHNGADDRAFNWESRVQDRVSYNQQGSRSHVHGRLGNAVLKREADSYEEGYRNSGNNDHKATFYFNNTPDRTPLYRLRQFF